MNCHSYKHCDVNCFNENYEEIKKKSIYDKELRLKIDRDEVLNMYNSGMSQKDIISKLKCGKSTISDIFKELGIRKMDRK